MHDATTDPDRTIDQFADQLICHLDLAAFIELVSRGTWRRAPHLDHLCRTLEAVERGEISRLIVTMPPRHGKSEVISKHFPAWVLGKHPDWEIILTSYGADLAQDFSRIAREKLREFGPTLFNVSLAQDSSAVNRWGIAGHRGGLTAVGAGGAITGRGAHVAIIDDPMKGPEEAASATQRRHIIEWYQTVLRTRLAPGGAIILIMTRWHRDDLAGHLIADMAAGGEDWTVLNLPALAGDDDPLGRPPGTPLWPDRFSRPDLDAIRHTLGEYWWQCLYQQSPGDPEGHLFKRSYFRYYSVEGQAPDIQYVLRDDPDGGDRRYHADNCLVFQTCDPATSTRSSADWFVLATWAVTPQGDLLLLDVVRERIEGPDQPDLFTQAYQRWHPVAQGVESVGLGKTIYQSLVRTGLPVVELVPDRDKLTRAIPMAARYQAGTVYHPQQAPWLGEWEEELAAFPNGPHDDQVDAASYAYVMLMDIDRYRPAAYRQGDFT